MNSNRQITGDGPSDITSIRPYLLDITEYKQQREDRWRSTRTSDNLPWDSDHHGRFKGPLQEKQQETGQPLAQRIVLHIDDDEEDRMLLEEALQQLDARIRVQQADSGKVALSFLEQSKKAGNLPCLIVLDINMPGMNGKEVMKEIKKDQELASLPLILFTTSPESTYRDLIKKENVQFITKPLTASELFDSAKKMLKYCPQD
jgi:CheY-like chemotaxis protein